MKLTKFQRNIIIAAIIIVGAMYLMNTNEQIQIKQSCTVALSPCENHADCCPGLLCVATSNGNMCLDEQTYVLLGTGE